MEKWMIVYLLPLEVWMDIFCYPWITREKFGQIVDKIGNFKFAEDAQFFLHQWGKRSLGELHFDKDGLFKFVGDFKPVRPEIPRTEIPENIKYFDNIKIWHFDATVMAFLDRIGSLLVDVDIDVTNFTCSPNLDNLPTILTHLAPMLDGGGTHLHSLGCDECAFPMVEQCFRDKFAKLKVLKINPFEIAEGLEQENVNFVLDWLAQREQDGPRLCKFHMFYDVGFSAQISQAIRQQFFAAKTPCTFAVIVSLRMWKEQLAEFHLENGIGEELHGVCTKHPGLYLFQISRHQANGNVGLQEWINANAQRTGHGPIQIYGSTLGSFDAAQIDMQPVDEGQDVQQQPCSSKDA